jgi:CcmD family protein
MSPLEHQYLLYLFVAYSAVWIVMFGFLYRMSQKARELEREVFLMRAYWDGLEEPRESPLPGDGGVPGPTV